MLRPRKPPGTARPGGLNFADAGLGTRVLPVASTAGQLDQVAIGFAKIRRGDGPGSPVRDAGLLQFGHHALWFLRLR
jgi:hypothetical protein